jgi:hypothetical protein
MIPPFVMLILFSLHNKHVVWSVDSARDAPHSWCDFDNPTAAASTIPFGRKGTRVIEMNTSNEFDAIVQMDKRGISLSILINI